MIIKGVPLVGITRHPAAGQVTIKLKSVDDLTTRIQDVGLNVQDNMGVC